MNCNGRIRQNAKQRGKKTNEEHETFIVLFASTLKWIEVKRIKHCHWKTITETFRTRRANDPVKMRAGADTTSELEREIERQKEGGKVRTEKKIKNSSCKWWEARGIDHELGGDARLMAWISCIRIILIHRNNYEINIRLGPILPVLLFRFNSQRLRLVLFLVFTNYHSCIMLYWTCRVLWHTQIDTFHPFLKYTP